MNASPVTAGRLRIGLAVAATALLASACGAGLSAQTANEHPTLDGTNSQVGPIGLHGMSIEAPAGNSYAPGSTAPLTLVLVNNGGHPDTLTSITSRAISGWGSYAGSGGTATASPIPASASATSSATTSSSSAAPAGGSQRVTIPAGGRVSFGVPEARNSLLLTGVKQRLWPGYAVQLTFTFQNAGAVTVATPVALTDHPGTAVVGDTSSPPGGG